MTTILLIDDQPGVLRGLRRMLRVHAPQWEAVTAESADEALAILRDQVPDVIVSDIRMPERDGLEFIAEVRNDPRLEMVPIIMLSGHGTEQDEHLAWELGIHDFVAKPVQPLKFIARIRAAVRIKRFAEYLKKQNDTLHQDLERLQQLETLAKLAAEATHDLNNMLAITIGRTELAQHAVADSAPAKASLSQALQSAEHAKRLVENMRSLGQATGTGPPVDLATAVNESMDLITMVLPPTIKTEVRCDPLGRELPVNSTSVYQLLLNLCTNAKHAMGSKGTLTVTVQETDAGLASVGQHNVSGRQAGALVQVKDTGHGMSEETMKKIWEPFFTTKDHPQGTGVGLAVVKRIVDDLHATIAVQSTVGTGSCFTVFIPYQQAADGQSADTTERAGNAEEADIIR